MAQRSIVSYLKRRAANVAPELRIRWRLAHRRKSAEFELMLLRNIVGPADTVIDVGANIGSYTRELARLSAKVYAFEPSRSMADMLRRTSAPNVIVHAVALSDEDGAAQLRIPRDGPHLTHSLASLEIYATAGRDVIVEDVPRRRLDSVIHGPVTFIKTTSRVTNSACCTAHLV